MNDIDEVIARVKELDAGATKGEWEAGSAMCCPDMGWVQGPKGAVCPQYEGAKRTHTLDATDAELIAYYRNAAPQLAAEVERLRAENAELREALSPFAAMSDGLLPDPHPCSVRCWRVGGPCNTSGGVCEECGTRASRDDECVGLVTYGDTRRARAALAKGGG